MTRGTCRTQPKAAAAMALLLAALAFAPAASGQQVRVIRVPGDAETVQLAIEMAEPGDVVLLDPGTYPGEVVVPEDADGITIRGVDRNAVVIDGGYEQEHAISVLADGVMLENLSATGFEGNAFEWIDVEGFTGRYLTAWNVEYYGVYAISSSGGLVEDSYVSGAADAAFYIGECRPCDTTIRRVTARLSAIGYSGTNASGDMVLRDSVFDSNGTGIMPNSYDEERFPPQGSMTIVGNVVTDSGRVPTPNAGPLGGFHGMGIGIAGGVENLVQDNRVTASARYGIALYPTFQREGPPWTPEGNVVRRNEVSGSGLADLAVSEGSGDGNCFEANTAAVTLPADLAEAAPCPDGSAEGYGDSAVAALLAVPPPEADTVTMSELGERPDYSEMPEPEAQTNLPGAADLPPAGTGTTGPGGGSTGVTSPWAFALVGAGLGAALIGALAVVMARRSRRPPAVDTSGKPGPGPLP
jgi:hypothetical protein